MGAETIALLPPQGFCGDHTSKEAIGWLARQQRQLCLSDFRSARTHGEISIGGLKVDGFGTDPFGHKHIFEYHGC